MLSSYCLLYSAVLVVLSRSCCGTLILQQWQLIDHSANDTVFFSGVPVWTNSVTVTWCTKFYFCGRFLC